MLDNILLGTYVAMTLGTTFFFFRSHPKRGLLVFGFSSILFLLILIVKCFIYA